MEDFTFPSVGARFKKWECCTSIHPKGLIHSLNFPEKNKKRKKKN
jgi:hypothetical protein